MEFLNAPCAANSTGAVNGLFGLLLQTIGALQCGIIPQWPKDYGPEAMNQGYFEYITIEIPIEQHIFFSKLVIRLHHHRCWFSW